MYRFNLFLPERQIGDLRDIAKRAGISVAELMRRMVEKGTSEPALNELIPGMSGCLVNSVSRSNLK